MYSSSRILHFKLVSKIKNLQFKVGKALCISLDISKQKLAPSKSSFDLFCLIKMNLHFNVSENFQLLESEQLKDQILARKQLIRALSLGLNIQHQIPLVISSALRHRHRTILSLTFSIIHDLGRNSPFWYDPLSEPAL